jgi:AcrR family transcriptional regulator
MADGGTKAKRGNAYHHGDLRRALIAAARRILEQEGIAALSLRAAARVAGVSQAAPYHHFADRDALLSAVAAEGFDGLADAMRSRMEKAADASRALVAAGEGYVAFAVANPALFQIMFGASMKAPGADPGRLEAGARAYAALEHAVAGVARSGRHEPQEIAIACLRAWSMAHGLAKLLVEGAIDPRRYGSADAVELAGEVLKANPLV